jgi:hypothetical protein
VKSIPPTAPPADPVTSVWPGPRRPAIVAFAPGTWRWPEVYGSTRYHLWTLAGMGWPVLYVEPPNALRLSTSMWTAPDRPFHALSPGRVAPFAVSQIPGERIGENWRQVTGRQLWGRALEAVAQLRLGVGAYWFGAPWHSCLADLIERKDALRIVHVYDELSASPILSPVQSATLWGWERELLRGAHLALCSSLPQMSRRSGIAARTVLLENGVADGHLADPLPPADARAADLIAKAQAAPHPRIMYGGVADLRLDPALFELLAASCRPGSLLFAGSMDDSFPSDAKRRLARSPQVRMLGPVPYSAYPHLYREADVLVIGHLRNEFTESMLPEKLTEYLASGKPIVSVALPEVKRVCRGLPPGAVRIAHTHGEFLEAVAEAAQDTDPALAAARRSAAGTRTWSALGQRLQHEIETAMRGL